MEKLENKIFGGTASIDLTAEIAKHLKWNLGEIKYKKFKDGEFQTQFLENLRGCNVFIVQSTYSPSDNLFELLIMLDAAKRASSKEVIAVIPYFGFSRQDRKDRPRVPISAKLIANLLQTAGVHRIITLDLHADQIQGFFDIPVENIYASYVFVDIIKKMKLNDLILASPDVGSSKRVSAYAKELNVDFVVCYKNRVVSNEVESVKIIGEVKDKNVIILDDIVDTAGTIVKAAEEIKRKEAKSIKVFCTHAVLSENALELIEKSDIEKIYVTNTIPLKTKSPKLEVVSVAPLFADVINRVISNESISKLFIF